MTGPAEPALRATVLVPTTSDRGPVLRYSVGSVLAQTVQELEVFIVGDGVDSNTRSVCNELAEMDSRVRFFDYPKHERRGEPYRHELLSHEASGAVVCYLCDRDLWLPSHVEEAERLLTAADLAHTLRYNITEDDSVLFRHRHDLRSDRVRSRATDFIAMLLPLSFAAHRLDAYRNLPFGWRTTPPELPTDGYMWAQFLSEPWVRVAAGFTPTVLTFKRGKHPGWSTDERLKILERWQPRIATNEARRELHEEIYGKLWLSWREADQAKRRLKRRLSAAEQAQQTRGWARRARAMLTRLVRRTARLARRAPAAR